MAQAPSPATKSVDLPTIIVDPSLYEPERPRPTRTLYDNFIRLSRVTLAASAVGTATFGVAHVLELHSLLRREHVSAHTAAVLDRVAIESERLPAPPAPRHVPLPLAPEAPEPAALPEEASESELVSTPEESASAVAPTVPSDTPPAHAPAATERAEIASKPSRLLEDVRAARRLLAMNRLEEAEVAYRRVLALQDDQPAALTGLARVQLARGQLDDALASATRAVEVDPSAAGAHLALGDVLRARGEKAAAQARYDQAAQLASARGDSTSPR